MKSVDVELMLTKLRWIKEDLRTVMNVSADSFIERKCSHSLGLVDDVAIKLKELK